MNGQINLGTNFGQLINKISKMKENKIFVEFGTWNGQGSTYCVMDALLQRDDNPLFISLEIDHKKYLEALSLWNKILIPEYADKKEILNLIYGKIIDTDDPKYYKKEQLESLKGYDPIWQSWHNEEIEAINKAPHVRQQIPESIDVLILDGGEFCTLAEFNQLSKNINNFIILDDCNVLKCREVYRILSNSDEWKIYEQDLNDRNGYAIFKKIK